MSQNKLGPLGEKIALQYLVSIGYRLIEKNFKNYYGEIDLVVQKGKEMVFVEVKTVSIDRGYDPVEQITPRKLIHLKNVINGYLSYRKVKPNQVYRLDFVGIIVDMSNKPIKIDHRQSI